MPPPAGDATSVSLYWLIAHCAYSVVLFENETFSCPSEYDVPLPSALVFQPSKSYPVLLKVFALRVNPKFLYAVYVLVAIMLYPSLLSNVIVM